MDDLDKFPSQLAERFQVRLPDGMRDRLRAEAEANKRSMNAEIVARLEASLLPQEVLERPEHSKTPPTEDNTLYVLLDTNGMPISWNEALTHLSEINKAGKLKFHTQSARILSSDNISNAGRDDDDLALFLRYRKLNKRKLSKAALAFLEEVENREATGESAD